MKPILSVLLLHITTCTLDHRYQQVTSPKVLKLINALKTHPEFHESALFTLDLEIL